MAEIFANPQIRMIHNMKLVGLSAEMSYVRDRTFEIWRNFIPSLDRICNRKGNHLISLQVYPPAFHFDPHETFVKWAAAEVTAVSALPEGFSSFDLECGMYAVFHYKGLNTDHTIFRYIFRTWLPASGYVLDYRPHFEILGKKYKNNDPESEEDIYIPVKLNDNGT